MKWRALILLILIVIWGIGCQLADKKPESDLLNPVVNATFLGLVEAVDIDTQHIKVVLPEGGIEDIALSKDIKVEQSLVGALVEISGKRNLGSQVVLANSLITVSEGDGLQLITPEESAKIISPLVVSGFARAGEQLEWQIENSSEQELSSGSIFISGDTGNFTPLRLEIFLPAIKEQDFFVIFTFGNEKKKISLRLLSTQLTHIQTFYSSPDLSSGECGLVFPISREISQTSAVARAAIVELLAGPTVEEQENGYQTILPVGVWLKSLTVLQGVATLDLIDSKHGLQPGSCDYLTAMAQVNETLMSIEGIEKVQLSINGQ